VTGPAWSSLTSRGTGAGTTELTRLNGFLTNKVQITGRNGSTTYTIAANRATYLGTFQTDSGAAGAVTDSFGTRNLWNAYNLEVISDNFKQTVIYQGTTPIGGLVDFGGSTAPAGWVLCYGQAISRTTYARLFDVLGTTHGVGDGSTTFNVPDLRGRVAAGKGDMGGSDAARLTATYFGAAGTTLGAVGGLESHTLTTAQLASHTHTGTSDSGGVDHNHTLHTTATNVSPAGATAIPTTAFSSGGTTAAGTTDNSSAYLHTHTFTTAASGSGNAHNNTQPTIILNKIMFAGA
jgi:microcystin-dependent protein